MAIENEYKFTSDRIDAASCLALLEDFVKESGIRYRVSTKMNTDQYYDSDGMEITAKGCFIRKRTNADGKCKLTVKRPISSGRVTIREEIEKGSDGSFESVQDLCNDCFPGVSLNPVPILINKSERTVFSYDDDSGIKLSFDKCRYVDGDNRKDYLEIELEVVSERSETDFDKIGVVDFVTNILGFRSVTESKYARGLKWKGL